MALRFQVPNRSSCSVENVLVQDLYQLQIVAVLPNKSEALEQIIEYGPPSGPNHFSRFPDKWWQPCTWEFLMLCSLCALCDQGIAGLDTKPTLGYSVCVRVCLMWATKWYSHHVLCNQWFLILSEKFAQILKVFFIYVYMHMYSPFDLSFSGLYCVF